MTNKNARLLFAHALIFATEKELDPTRANLESQLRVAAQEIPGETLDEDYDSALNLVDAFIKASAPKFRSGRGRPISYRMDSATLALLAYCRRSKDVPAWLGISQPAHSQRLQRLFGPSGRSGAAARKRIVSEALYAGVPPMFYTDRPEEWRAVHQGADALLGYLTTLSESPPLPPTLRQGRALRTLADVFKSSRSNLYLIAPDDQEALAELGLDKDAIEQVRTEGTFPDERSAALASTALYAHGYDLPSRPAPEPASDEDDPRNDPELCALVAAGQTTWEEILNPYEVDDSGPAPFDL